MATNFPATLDTLANPSGSNTLSSPSHASQHSNANDAIEAIQAKIGVDNSAVTTSIDYKVRVWNPVGEITMWSTTSAPTGWLICDGSAVSRTTYSGLFAVVGTTFGSGDGSTTFNLPDFRGKVAVGRNTGDASFDILGETGGSKTNALGSSNLPAHTHAVNDSGHAHGGYGGTSFTVQYMSTAGGSVVTTAGPYTATNFATTATATTGITVTGGGNGTATGDAFSIVQPYLTVNFIIRH